MQPLVVVILTLDEELNLPKALRSVGARAPVIVLDSGSSDSTQEIARAAGAELHVHQFVDYASQRNHALDLCRGRFRWVFFLDADEELSPPLWDELEAAIARDDLDGAYLRLEVWALGRCLTHGEYATSRVLRLLRPDVAVFRRGINERVDDRDMRVTVLKTRLIHRDLRPLADWFHKHVRYAQKEAQAYLDGVDRQRGLDGFNLRTKAGRTVGIRWLYNRLPLFVRPFAFHARALAQGAWLDGLAGAMHAGMHALWYPMLIDLLIYEQLQARRRQGDADRPG
ncbi:MAG: glycosyltransferase family 2 protein [Nannocystis sp.]|nr:glycosyltransferase family 2 protein [Nannocystis sp.]